MVLDRLAGCLCAQTIADESCRCRTAQQTDNDQIDRNDIVQQSRHHKNEIAAHLKVALRLPYRHPLANLPFAVRLRLYAVQRVWEQRPEWVQVCRRRCTCWSPNCSSERILEHQDNLAVRTLPHI